MDEKLSPPEATAKDMAVGVIKAAGKTLAQFFAYGLAPTDLVDMLKTPLEKRKEDFFRLLTDRVNEHHEQLKTIQIEYLEDDPEFVSTIIEAITIWMRNHQEEKRQALLNAVINSALQRRPSDDMRKIFLNLIDIFSPLHLRFLAFINDPGKYMHEKQGFGKRGIEETKLLGYFFRIFPEYEKDKDLVALIRKDLLDRQLIHETYFMDSAHQNMRVAGTTLPIGRKFLEFINDPLTGTDS